MLWSDEDKLHCPMPADTTATEKHGGAGIMLSVFLGSYNRQTKARMNAAKLHESCLQFNLIWVKHIVLYPY